MNENRNNDLNHTIRPITIRIVNPTPKKDNKKEAYSEASGSAIKKMPVSFLFFLMLGCLVFFLSESAYVFFADQNLITWKLILLKNILFALIAIGLPILAYAFYQPEILENIKWKSRSFLILLFVAIGLTLANVLNILNILASKVLVQIGLKSELWSATPFLDYTPSGSLVFSIIYAISFILIPAFLLEFSLRQILVKRNLKAYTNLQIILFQALLNGLLAFYPSLFIPYFGLGLLSTYLYIAFGNLCLNLVFHVSFNFMYHYLLDKLDFLQFNLVRINLLSDYFPLILNILLNLSILIPLVIFIGQFTKSNPVWKKDQIAFKNKRKIQKEGLMALSFCILGVLYILNAAIF